MLSLSAPKGSKCLCGKRATSTLMSRDGKRALSPCCTTCGIVFMQLSQLREADDASQAVPGGVFPELRQFCATRAGVSSWTIVSVLVPELREFVLGRLGGSGPSVPWDPSDFWRRRQALALIPNGVARLGEVAAAYPKWKPLVDAWAELDALFEEESQRPDGNAPKLYARMKELTR